MTLLHEPQCRLFDEPGSEDDSADHDYLRLTARPGVPFSDALIDVLDLFAGCGGLTLGALEGARREGVAARLALGVDIDPGPLRVLQATLNDNRNAVREADLARVLRPVGSRIGREETDLLGRAANTLVLAGPPCQGHSALNNYTRHDDHRNELYLAVARVAQILEPRAIIVENVRGVGADRLGAMMRCSEALAKLGYHVDSRRLDLHQLGVPQRRIRHVLVATSDRPFRWELSPGHPHDLRWAIGDLEHQAPSEALDRASAVTPDNRRRIDWLFDNGEMNLPNELRPRCHQSDHSYRSMYGRLTWDAPAQTVTSGYGSMGQGRYVHPSRRRTLTPHEAARLQFLPDFVRFDLAVSRSALANMIGNAAPPKLSMALVQSLIRQALL